MIEAEPHAPFPIASREFWAAYGVQMRPYLLFVSGITGLVGLAVTPEPSTLRVLVLAPVFCLTYGFGQALTDCFQLDTDSLSSSYRPLVRRELRRRDVLRVSLTGLVVSGIVIALCDPLTIPLAVACIVGLATYTPFKRRWWAGPFYNAWIVAGLFAVAMLAGDATASLDVLDRPVVAATALAVFFGYANFVLAGYFKDVRADRATGYDTMPVRFGFRVSAWASDGLALAAVVAAVAAAWLAAGELSLAVVPAMAFLVAGMAASVSAQVRLHAVRRDEEAHRAIAPVVHAYLLLLAGVGSAAQPAWALPLLLFYLAFIVVLRARPVAAQI